MAALPCSPGSLIVPRLGPAYTCNKARQSWWGFSEEFPDYFVNFYFSGERCLVAILPPVLHSPTSEDGSPPAPPQPRAEFGSDAGLFARD